MGLFFYPIIVVAAIVLLSATVVLFIRKDSSRIKEKKKRKKRIRAKDREAILRAANKKLAQNPKDPHAHLSLADLYFQEKNHELALKYYKVCIELCATVPQIDEFEVTVRHALSALNVKNYEEAYKSFMIARTLNGEGFEVNYNLGYLEYIRKNFQKSASYLQKARLLNPEHVETNRYLGHSLFRIKKYKDAISTLRRAIEYEPENKNTLFTLAQSHFELTQYDFALKIFSHLRTDPVLGSNAALYSGTIHLNNKQYQKAIMDFEIGLRHEGIAKEIALELKYRMAASYLCEGDIPAAINTWKEVQEIQPDYKDIKDNLRKYQEINTNRHLQIFLLASASEFVTLCRKIATAYFPKASTKLLDISLHRSEYVDILADVNTRQWDELVLYRFIRSTGQIGEFMLRELYARIKELKAGRGICIAPGSFSDSARTFVEARLIDLVEKEELLKHFGRLEPGL
ncbi:hypothetical protein ES703_87811 [subsurface metagenome]